MKRKAEQLLRSGENFLDKGHLAPKPWLWIEEYNHGQSDPEPGREKAKTMGTVLIL